MQREQRFHPRKAVPSIANQVGGNYMNVPVASSFDAVLPPAAMQLMPGHDVQFQPCEVCPRNFVIFDQTDHRSQIMFNPAIAHKFSGPGLNMFPPYIQGNYESKQVNGIEREIPSSLKEDSDDIDALLSLEEEEQEEYDEEEVSTARTNGNYGSDSPDSYTSYGFGSKPRKHASSSSVQKSPDNGSGCNSERKREKMKKMVKKLRGIVPGADQMNTVTVLDEAVRYLKSLKVEVQKLGVGNFKN